MLVATFLTAAVLGLLIPAVGHARAKASTRESSHKMRKLAQALLSCHDAHGCLPPAYDAFAGIDYPASVHVHLLPFIGEESLYQSYLQKGKSKTDAFVDAFHSPGDGTLGEGVQNFAANLRVFAEIGASYNARPVPLAAVMPGKARIPQSFVCGASNTMVFATKVGASRQQTSANGIEIKGGSRYDANPTSPFAAFFGENAAKKPAHPSDPEATFQLAPRGSECLVWPLLAQSFDQQGIIVALGDGSVRRFSPDVSPGSWNYAMQASSSGAVLGLDW
jgi:hypothetical protein